VECLRGSGAAVARAHSCWYCSSWCIGLRACIHACGQGSCASWLCTLRGSITGQTVGFRRLWCGAGRCVCSLRHGQPCTKHASTGPYTSVTNTASLMSEEHCLRLINRARFNISVFRLARRLFGCGSLSMRTLEEMQTVYVVLCDLCPAFLGWPWLD